MRKIKFRAWDKVLRKMIYFDLDSINDMDDCTIYENIMQYTGLKDKNGKEIYEGDVVKVEDENYLCEWDEEFGGFEFSDREEFVEAFLGGARYKDMKIIGNIYENPEMSIVVDAGKTDT